MAGDVLRDILDGNTPCANVIDCPQCGATPGTQCTTTFGVLIEDVVGRTHPERVLRRKLVEHWLLYMREYHPDDMRDFVVGTIVMGELGREPTLPDVETRFVGGGVLVRCALGEFD